MKNVLLVAILPLCAWIGHASCFEGSQRLLVRKYEISSNGMPYYFQVPVLFSPATSIAAIKKVLYTRNNIPVLTKPASQGGEVAIRLESDKMCADYGLQNGQILDFTITSKAQINAELQASTPLNNDVISMVLSYDPDFHQATQKS